MAGTRKAALEALKSQDLSQPKRMEDGKLVVENMDDLATEFRDRETEIKALQESQKELKLRIVEQVAKKRAQEEKRGHHCKTCILDIDDDEHLYVTWKDSYKTINVDHEPEVKKAFGKHYPDLFGKQLTVKILPGASLERVRELMTQTKMNAVAKYLQFGEQIVFAKEFQDSVSRLHAAFVDDELVETTRSMIERHQSDPSLKVEKKKEEKKKR